MVLVALLLVSGGAASGPAFPAPVACAPADSDRVAAFRTMVIFRLGAGLGGDVPWNPRTVIPTFASFSTVSRLAARRGWDIDAWLFQDRAVGPLEASAGRWRPALQNLAFPARRDGVPSVDESLAAFNLNVRPLERGEKTRFKYQTHRLSILTWAVWNDVLHLLLPMSDDLLRAYIWDSLAFGASLPVLKHAVDAVKAWHRLLGMPPPVSGPGDHRRLVSALSRFQAQPHRIKFPLHADIVRRLLLLPAPVHPPCCGVKPPFTNGSKTRCPICWAFLHRWVDCLAGAVLALICGRCKEGGQLQVCDVWWRFDDRAGFPLHAGGAAINIGVRKNDQFRHGHQARIGVAKDPRLDALAQLAAVMDLLGTGRRAGCSKEREPGSPCSACGPLFPRRINKGQDFDLSRTATSAEMSAMVLRGVGHIGLDTSLFSGISARKGGLSTAIEAGVPEAILWMQSGHAQDVAARRYVALQSPALLYRTWESFGL